ncbi:PEP-CTERM sorting domain-containing protein [Alteromonas genovensis]|jgi:hypothetical protein|uniref:PEP-CTERM sorting domain-containing protein n=1 Tax=Alteromonas genovensis TaxID=471225 RepID=UPI002FE04068
MRCRKITEMLFALIVLSTSSAQASVILSPISVVSNTLGNFDGNITAENLINQTGLSLNFTSGLTDFSTYIASNPTHADSSTSPGPGWASINNDVLSGTLVFDLGATYALNKFVLWGDVDTQTVGLFSLDISDDISFGAFSTLGGGTGTVSTTGTADIFTLSTFSGRYVRWNIFGNLGASNLVQAGEIAFEANAVIENEVPEPATLGIFGLALLAIRRLKRS